MDRLGQLAFRAPLAHREIQARTDKMDKMDLLGQLALQALEARMASTASAIRESEGRQASEDRREVQAPLDRPVRA